MNAVYRRQPITERTGRLEEMVSGSRVLVWSEMDSPIGSITFAMTGKGLCRLDFMNGSRLP